MRTTRAGFTDEDFYGSNDTDVVHFRYLHKLLRQVPTMTLSDVPDGKFTQYVDHEATASKYGSNTYKTTVTTMNYDHTVSDHVFNPYIDPQLDKHYQDVVKPQVDRLDKRIDDLTKVVKQQGEAITALQSTVHDQGESITALQSTVHDQGESITALQSTVHDQGESITALQTQYSEQTKQLTALDKRLTALEQPDPTK
jgi:uncharacterized coiled-coil protein SlyX